GPTGCTSARPPSSNRAAAPDATGAVRTRCSSPRTGRPGSRPRTSPWPWSTNWRTPERTGTSASGTEQESRRRLLPPEPAGGGGRSRDRPGGEDGEVVPGRPGAVVQDLAQALGERGHRQQLQDGGHRAGEVLQGDDHR